MCSIRRLQTFCKRGQKSDTGNLHCEANAAVTTEQIGSGPTPNDERQGCPAIKKDAKKDGKRPFKRAARLSVRRVLLTSQYVLQKTLSKIPYMCMCERVQSVMGTHFSLHS